MTPEKAAVLGVTALIAVLLAIALLSSQPRPGQLPRTAHRSEPRSPRTAPPEDWRRHGDLIEVVRSGGARTRSRPPRRKKEPRSSKRGSRASQRQKTTPPTKAGTYVIRDGDTFEGVGIRLYGRKGLGLKIARANPGIDPRRLRGGMRIRLPDLDGKKSRPAPGPPRTGHKRSSVGPAQRHHVVASGDVLTGISLQHYGTIRHWRRIFEANRDQLKNPDRLRAGMRLRLPRIPGDAAMARR